MPIYENVELTPKESVLMEAQKEEAERSREHAVRMKELEIQFMKEKFAGEVELRKLEAQWNSWLKLPSMIIKLPLYVLFGIAYIVDSFKRGEPSKDFWKFIQ